YFLLDNETTGKTEKFSTDIKNESEDGYIYDFEVVGNVAGKKNLLIEPKFLPEEYQYVVVNKQSKIKYPSNKIELYSDKNNLQLIVGTEEFVSSQTIDYNFVPVNFSLAQNYPNPFNPSTIIKYQLPSFNKISINIYNVLGQKVKTLINNEEQDAGYFQINWDGTNNSGIVVASGIYFLNFRSDQFSKSIKMLLQR
ncbi:MAG: T9SS type A sorting domain-containing protein, partial [Calditrichia bacterium]|nr:T9SS type A sorting domain-containing protein [Calditrichia bacterium]